MNIVIKRSQAIQYVIIALAVLLFLGLWPTKLIHRNHDTAAQPLAYFITEGHYLESVDLVVNSRAGYSDEALAQKDADWQEALHQYADTSNYAEPPVWDNDIDYTIYDEYGNIVASIHYEVDDDIEDGTPITMPVRVELGRGYAYYYDLTGAEDPTVYHYQVYFADWQYVVMAIIIAIVTAMICYLLHRLFTGPLSGYEGTLTLQSLLKWSLTPVIAGLVIWQLILVIGYRYYENRLTSIVFYSFGIVALAAYTIYALWRRRTATPSIDVVALWRDRAVNCHRIQSLLQAICFAGCIWHCCQYWNGIYNIHHYTSLRRMLIWFCLALLVSFRPKELCNIFIGIYLVGSLIFSYFLVKPYIGVTDDELLYKLTAHIVVLGGIALVNIVRSLIISIRKQEYQLPDLRIAIPTAVLMLGMAIFYNTNTWVFVTIAMMLALALRMISWEHRDTLGRNIGNGVIFSFLWMAGYCLWHRPFNAYQLYRYGMVFHTVTVTAEYMTMVVAVVVARFIIRYRELLLAGEQHVLAAMWPEVILLGASMTYMITTLSRTGLVGIVAVIGMAIIVYAVASLSKHKQGSPMGLYRVLWKPVLIALMAIIVLFFSTFTLMRIVPSLTRAVEYTELEAGDELVYNVDAPDSDKYMNPKRWVYCFGVKMLGITEDADVRNQMTDRYNELVTRVAGKLGIDIEIDRFTGNVHILSKKHPGEYMLLTAEDEPDESEDTDVSNGRIEIFRYYIAQWNLTGHKDMWVLDDQGGEIVHAHNSFLQAIHDFGLIVGIYLIIYVIYAAIYCIIRYNRGQDDYAYILVTLTILVGFTAASMTEYMYNIYNPVGWAFFMCLIPMLFMGQNNKIKDHTLTDNE